MKRNYLFRSWFENVYTEELNEDVINAVRLYFLFDTRKNIVWRKGISLTMVNYYKQVWDISDIECSKLPDISRRGWPNNLTVDHIIPISYAYRNGFPAAFIGSINNLQMLTRSDNTIKGAKIIPSAEKLIKEYELTSKQIKDIKADRQITYNNRWINKGFNIGGYKLQDSRYIRVYDMNTAEKIMEFNL